MKTQFKWKSFANVIWKKIDNYKISEWPDIRMEPDVDVETFPIS
jgi:hypothetical protein